MENAGEICLPTCTNTSSCRRPFPVGTTTCPDCGKPTEERPLSSLKHLIPSEYYDIMVSLAPCPTPIVSESPAAVVAP